MLSDKLRKMDITRELKNNKSELLKIQHFTGYDLRSWIVNNIAWMDDFSAEMREHITKYNLGDYLI